MIINIEVTYRALVNLRGISDNHLCAAECKAFLTLKRLVSSL